MTFISSEIKTQRTFEKHSSQKEKDFKQEILKKKKLVHTLEHPYGTAL